MLKKMMALAASTAMLGANAAAYAIVSVRTAVKNVTGAGEAGEPGPATGTSIQPSIPPMPPEAEHKAAPRKAAAHKVATHKVAAHKAGARKASAAKAQHAKVTHRKARPKSTGR